MQVEGRDCCRSAGRQREKHLDAYIHHSCHAARVLRRSVVTVSVVWIKLLSPAGLLACVRLSMLYELHHGLLCLARALRLQHIAFLLDSCHLH